VLTRVDKGHLDEPTPCASWDVHTLVNHMVIAPRVAAGIVSGASGSTEADFAAGDFVAAHDETARLALQAFSAPGALDKPVEFPFGARTAAILMFFVANDQVAHAWDLARAIGSATDFAPSLAVELLGEAGDMVTEEMRGADGAAAFGPEKEAPSGASAADRLAAFLGRSV
jgi:uncharacterized protein (TIGR03086 family)